MAKRTDFQKAVVAAVEAGVDADVVTCKADGSVVVKRSFFYRHGASGETWASKVKEACHVVGVKCSAEGDENWAAWPKTSYFIAIVRPA